MEVPSSDDDDGVVDDSLIEHDDDEDDEDVSEVDNDDRFSWKRRLSNAILFDEESLEEIRDLVLRQMPKGFRTTSTRRGLGAGAAALQAALLLAGSRNRLRLEREDNNPPQRGRGRRQQQPQQDRTLPLIQFLVEKAGWGPEILTEKLECIVYGSTMPLGLAIFQQCSPELVRYLVNMAPGAVRIRSSMDKADMYYPIHVAVDRPAVYYMGDDEDDDSRVAEWDTIQCLLEAWPESIRKASPRGWLPVHYVIKHLQWNPKCSHNRRVLKRLVNWWPESLSRKTRDKYRHVALHVAINESVPVQDLRYLLNAYPQATRIKSAEGYLPLHYAFGDEKDYDGSAIWRRGIAKLPVIRALIRHDPTTLLEPTDWGLLPLHLFFRAEAEEENSDEASSYQLVKLMVDSCPESVRKVGRGWTALFYAAENPRTSRRVIRYLINAHPGSVRAREQPYHDDDDDDDENDQEEGRLALHVAVECDLSVASIEALIAADPDTLRTRTRKGDLPLHALLRQLRGPRQMWRRDPRHGNLLDLVRCLVTNCPTSVRERTSPEEGKIPLHLAVEMEKDASNDPEEIDAVIEYLLEQWPESVHEFTADRGWLALHCAAHHGRSPRVVQSLLDLWPDSARQHTRGGIDQPVLPIHLAAASRFISAPSFGLLLDAWPEAALEMSGKGWLPIHYAVGEQGTMASIERLLDLYPETLRGTTVDGYTPLHLAAFRRTAIGGEDSEEDEELVEDEDFNLRRRTKIDAIRLLVERDGDDPENALLLTRVVGDGSLPLHLALRSDVIDDDIVNYMVAQCPESVRCRDNAGALPLHWALSGARARTSPRRHGRKRLRKVVQILVTLHPDALLETDPHGRLPLHLAAESDRASLDVLYLILRSRPEAIQGERRGRGGGCGDGGGGGKRRRSGRRGRKRSSPGEGRRNASATKRR